MTTGLTPRYAGCVLVLAALTPATRADATLRYHTDMQSPSGVGLALPLETVSALAGMRDMTVQIRGNKARSAQGNLTSIMDLKTQDLTMVDVFNKRFAAVPAGQYAERAKTAMPAVPEAARAMLALMKTKIESRSTGRTAIIQGIQTEEREYVLTVDMAMPSGAPTAAPLLKMIMQVWIAKPEEAQRVPAVQELRNYAASATFAVNPAEMVKQLTAIIPGLGDSLGAMIGELSKDGGLALRTHTEIVVPLLVSMSQQMPQQGGQAPPAGLDPNAPLMQVTQELVELSTDLLDDAIFQVPADYQAAPLEEILRGAVSAAVPPQFKQ